MARDSKAGDSKGRAALPPRFRKLSIAERRAALLAATHVDPEDFQATGTTPPMLELSNVLIESAIGEIPVPLGIADGFLIDSERVVIPMATEEPSVIAAAGFAASLIGPEGGFTTWATDPIMTAQVFLEDAEPGSGKLLHDETGPLATLIRKELHSLHQRGGGLREIETSVLPESGVLRVHVHIDVRDAMGANILNTVTEKAKEELERLTGGRVLMSILTNSSERRRAGARFEISSSRLARANRAALDGEEVGRRIALASQLAVEDRDRAITNNKGIMNGITALALATGNDTRGVEAAAHAWASRGGRYRGLSTFTYAEGKLRGELELPLPLATVGGAVSYHPAFRACLQMLGNPDGRRLARIGAAVGLAQNFAALLSLVSTGIQKGHMKMHAARVAYAAGARGPEIDRLVELMRENGSIGGESAARLLGVMRNGRD